MPGRDRSDSGMTVKSSPNSMKSKRGGGVASPSKSRHKGQRIAGIKNWVVNFCPLSPNEESNYMEAAEHHQRRADRFWGKDKEASACRRERFEMDREQRRSEGCETYYK